MKACHICEHFVRSNDTFNCSQCLSIFCHACLVKYFKDEANTYIGPIQSIPRSCFVCLKKCHCFKCKAGEHIVISSHNNSANQNCENQRPESSRKQGIYDENEPIPETGIFKGKKIGEMSLFWQRLYLKKKVIYGKHQMLVEVNAELNQQKDRQQIDENNRERQENLDREGIDNKQNSEFKRDQNEVNQGSENSNSEQQNKQVNMANERSDSSSEQEEKHENEQNQINEDRIQSQKVEISGREINSIEERQNRYSEIGQAEDQISKKSQKNQMVEQIRQSVEKKAENEGSGDKKQMRQEESIYRQRQSNQHYRQNVREALQNLDEDSSIDLVLL